MFRAGSVSTTVCPSRILADSPAAVDFVDWWLWSIEWDGMTGGPRGAPRWPYRGGVLRQPNRLVEACRLLRSEWPQVAAAARPAEAEGGAR